MKSGKIYVVPHRRRREQRTDYRKRLSLLKSGKPRLVIRRSNNNMECQIAQHSPSGDRVIVSANSAHLRKMGWSAGTGNIPSSYLIGLLCGKLARERRIKEAVLDAGIVSPTPNSRIYACLKGALDAGLEVPHSEDVLPSEERIKGEHIASYLKKYSDLPKHFEEVKGKILGEQGNPKKAKKKGEEA